MKAAIVKAVVCTVALMGASTPAAAAEVTLVFAPSTPPQAVRRTADARVAMFRSRASKDMMVSVVRG